MHPSISRRMFVRSAMITPALITASGLLTKVHSINAASSEQPGWGWCPKCEELWFARGQTDGVCPAGGGHSSVLSGSLSYALLSSTVGKGQPDWWWCPKCSSLWFAGNRTHGVCPAGGEHIHLASGNSYALLSSSESNGQPDWWWCPKCSSLWFAGHQTHGSCPAGGEHIRLASGNSYALTSAPPPPPKVLQSDAISAGDCKMPDAALIFNSDGTGTFIAHVFTTHTSNRDIWHIQFDILDALGYVRFTLPSTDSYWDSPDMEEGGYYTFEKAFLYDNEYFYIIASAIANSRC